MLLIAAYQSSDFGDSFPKYELNKGFPCRNAECKGILYFCINSLKNFCISDRRIMGKHDTHHERLSAFYQVNADWLAGKRV